ncbi:MAG: NAD(P)/FAD-dependent oxidoreductase [Streptosporangiaceae bacterium]
MKATVAIIGAGPGGCACAARLASSGIQTVIIEKERFPRFHIGESLTGESGSLLRELGLESLLLDQGYPVKYGVRIYGPSGRENFWFPVKKRDPADPSAGLVDTFSWQVRRSSFDALLLNHALGAGATLIRGRAIAARHDSGRVRSVRVRPERGKIIDIEPDVLVDASGQQTFLANAGVTGPKQRDSYDRQVAVYAHFRGSVPDEGDQWGNTLLFLARATHWSWLIPLERDVVSIGIVVPGEYYQLHGEPKRDFLLRELREFNPELARRTTCAVPVTDICASSNYSYQVSNFTGENWACIGDAHRFVDPLFSFGVNIALAEAHYVADVIRALVRGGNGAALRTFTDFEKWSENGVDICQTLIDSFSFAAMAFGFSMHRHADDFIDLLAGRVWDNPRYAALPELRAALSGQPAAAINAGQATRGESAGPGMEGSSR